ncbi:MAG: hypothetical protein EOM87_06315 [Clostridia bacterium]|nr:hypothetical protein [Clostridia bacterium]
MDKEVLQAIIIAIKSDDLELFSSHIEKKRGLLSLCFGRLPLLSLCYLYKSRKIVKTYEKALSAVSGYIFVEEEPEAYAFFKKQAKRCLRLYVFSNKPVTPAEMLAILQESAYLEEVYPRVNKDEKTVSNIEKIYRILHGQTIEQKDNKITIKHKPLTRNKKIAVIIIIAIACFMIAFSGVSWGALYTAFGSGIITRPIKIYNESQLIRAIEQGEQYFTLSNDISLTSKWTPQDFDGRLNGNGNTVYVYDKMIDGFVTNLTGIIENVNFVFAELILDISENTSFIADTNNGTLSNIRVSISGNFTDTGDNDIFVAILAVENNGDITGCVIDADITFVGNGVADTYLCGITAWNNARVTACATTDNSVFTTDTVDVAGLVAENGHLGTVADCENHAEVYQHSDSDSWLPNAGGVALNNIGIVTDCENYGKITASSGSTSADALNLYVGGVVCINNNSIVKSKNNAAVTGISQEFHIYAGGVAAVNNNDTSTIDNSCSYGEISASTGATADVFLFVGGIAGVTYGTISNSYSASTYSAENGKIYVGGIAGVAFYYTVFFSKNNYYINKPNFSFGYASILKDNFLFDGSNSGVTKLNTMEELIALEVYWG